MKITKKQLLLYFCSALLLFLCSLTTNRTILGLMIIVPNMYLCIKSKSNRLLFLFSFLFAFINCSVAYFDLILGHVNAPLWQKNGLLFTNYDIQTSKSILITSIIVVSIIVPNIENFPDILKEIKRKDSPLISTGLITVLSLLIVFGYFTEIRGRNGYSSVANPIFEYSSLLIVLLWYYSKNRERLCKYFVNIYTLLYLIMFLSIGDRSSVAIVLVTTFVINYIDKFPIWKFIVVAFCLIFIFNIIGYARSHNEVSFSSLVSISFTKGLYVDTISWSYYASTTITALNTYVDEAWRFIFGNLLYFVTGISTTYSSMSNYGPKNFNDLYNQGGGIYPSYFFGMGGYVGTIVGAAIIGFIVVRFFRLKKNYHGIYAVMITVLMFRWYLYSISTLFRGVLVLATIAIIATKIVSDIEIKRSSSSSLMHK